MLRLAGSAWIPAVALLAACGPGSFEGTVSGVTLDVKDAAFTVAKDPAGQPELLVVYLSDQPNVCDLLKAGSNARSSTTLSLWFFQEDQPGGNTVVPTPGRYVVRDDTVTRHSLPELLKLDSGCLSNVDAAGLAGSATLDSYQAEPGGSLSGSFAVAFNPNGDQGKGTFNAPFCDAPWRLSGCQ
jgi:hypothetical protein